MSDVPSQDLRLGDFPSQDRLGQDWPPAVEIVNEAGRSPIVLLCEHASCHIPADYSRLGLPEAEVRRHIGWDIGAADVARGLSARLDAPLFLGTYSRLLVDLNRPLAAPSLIPGLSEATTIPGNREISDAERRRRIETIFAPFHAAVADHLDRRRNQPTILVTIHSFTPVFLGVARPWHAGILFDRSEAFARRVIARLLHEPGLNVAANEPYRIDASGDYAIPVHGEARGLEAILVEIRNDQISTPLGAAAWADRLAAALRPEIGA
ncbi:N-formylglutamate amidohydrolase [Segnochrobactrum spirostomi]|uniref:N-formylglutamate amidohydrolase n=1 Tax=Segnochrobactrum spirostomi TaxID=2608987 RepID=A0A6A7Y745_9HYPH|nr:N-formylglutamate amidohydrolase [Segnochrobactrum spirostomi]MQT15160.1 N-formylglutamate amidohydrolase [Segnochrobactrum spirostomi]